MSTKPYHEETVVTILNKLLEYVFECIVEVLLPNIHTGSCVINQGFTGTADTELHAMKLSVSHYIH